MDKEDVHALSHTHTLTRAPSEWTEVANECDDEKEKNRKIIEHHLHLIGFKRFLSSVTNRFNSNIFFLFVWLVRSLSSRMPCVTAVVSAWVGVRYSSRVAVCFSTWWSWFWFSFGSYLPIFIRYFFSSSSFVCSHRFGVIRGADRITKEGKRRGKPTKIIAQW